jgi:hypothetical protein
VFAGVLGGELIDLAEPPDSDLECLLVGQPGGLEVGDLVTQMALQLVGVGGVDGSPALEGCSPFGDPGLVCTHRHAPVAGAVKPQMPPRVRVAVSHWRRCSASWARPLSVMR